MPNWLRRESARIFRPEQIFGREHLLAIAAFVDTFGENKTVWREKVRAKAQYRTIGAYNWGEG